MPEQTDWETKAANLLKAELKRKGVSYAQLVEKLEGIGVWEKEVNIRNKLSRGKFSAAFLLQCLSAIGVDKDKWREVYYRDGLFVIEFLFHDDNQTHEATLQHISESELSKINPNERRQKLQVYEYTKYNRNLGL